MRASHAPFAACWLSLVRLAERGLSWMWALAGAHSRQFNSAASVTLDFLASYFFLAFCTDGSHLDACRCSARLARRRRNGAGGARSEERKNAGA